MTAPGRSRFLSALPWLALLIFPVVEVGAHAFTRAAVPTEHDWRVAADFVGERASEGDLFVAAPDWADPLVRQYLGDRIDLPMAGRTGVAGYRRLWSLSPRGARPPEAAGRTPELSEDFGGVRVERFALDAPRVLHDLVEHVADARVTQIVGGKPRPCEYGMHGPGRRGGLGYGVVPPARRFQCPDRRGFVWVAPVIMEDLELQPRRCVYQHPAGGEPVRVTVPDVPVGKRLEVHAGLYYEHERMLDGAPVKLVVRFGDEQVGEMIHRDGEGWRALTIDTAKRAGERVDVSFETTSARSHKRIFCWSARILSAGGPQ